MNSHTSKYQFDLRAYNTTQLARLYKVDYRTFNKWLKPHQSLIGERIGQMYNVNQVLIIIDKLGVPGDMELNNSQS